MRVCLFAGPSLHKIPTPNGVDVFEPATLGSVFQAVEKGYTHIGLVDGYFGNTHSVWHKEILYAIDEGAKVVGAASIGALRAAELHVYGMVGVGTAFRLFRRGALADDDEVCVIHGPREFQFSPLSEPMINFRYTLRRMRRLGIISHHSESKFVRCLKAKHFSVRTRDSLAKLAEKELGDTRNENFMMKFNELYVDVKKQDVYCLLERIDKTSTFMSRPKKGWTFPRTEHWVQQFERHTSMLPELWHWR